MDSKSAHVLLADFQGDILINGNNARIVARNMLFDSGIAHGIDQLLEPPSIGARCDNFSSIEIKVQNFKTKSDYLYLQKLNKINSKAKNRPASYYSVQFSSTTAATGVLK